MTPLHRRDFLRRSLYGLGAVSLGPACRIADPQGKGYAQRLLSLPVPVPSALAARIQETAR